MKKLVNRPGNVIAKDSSTATILHACLPVYPKSMLSSLLPPLTPEEPDSLFPSLTLKQRIYGWFTSYLIGCLITLASFGSFRNMIHGRSMKFAVLYTIGNLLSLFSTMFLVGPKKQWEMMVDLKRRLTSCVYLGSMIVTLILAIDYPEHKLGILVSVIVQWMALFWYSLSFIPYGRTVVMRVLLP